MLSERLIDWLMFPLPSENFADKIAEDDGEFCQCVHSPLYGKLIIGFKNSLQFSPR